MCDMYSICLYTVIARGHVLSQSAHVFITPLANENAQNTFYCLLRVLLVKQTS